MACPPDGPAESACVRDGQIGALRVIEASLGGNSGAALPVMFDAADDDGAAGVFLRGGSAGLVVSLADIAIEAMRETARLSGAALDEEADARVLARVRDSIAEHVLEGLEEDMLARSLPPSPGPGG